MTTSRASERIARAEDRAAEPDRFRSLPPRVRPEEMVESQATTELQDPNLNRDREADFVRSGVWAGG